MKKATQIILLSVLLIACSENKGSLSLEAAIIYKMNGPQPVARVQFYLLDDDLKEILRGIAGDSAISKFTLASLHPDTDATFYSQALQLIKLHTIQSATTDFSGKAEFQPVKPKVYYIMGVTETRGGVAIWNLRTEIKPGKNGVVLDQNNAEFAF